MEAINKKTGYVTIPVSDEAYNFLKEDGKSPDFEAIRIILQTVHGLSSEELVQVVSSSVESIGLARPSGT